MLHSAIFQLSRAERLVAITRPRTRNVQIVLTYHVTSNLLADITGHYTNIYFERTATF